MWAAWVWLVFGMPLLFLLLLVLALLFLLLLVLLLLFLLVLVLRGEAQRCAV